MTIHADVWRGPSLPESIIWNWSAYGVVLQYCNKHHSAIEHRQKHESYLTRGEKVFSTHTQPLTTDAEVVP